MKGIIKRPKNRSKGREEETEKEEGDNIEIDQIQFESVAPEDQQRQKTLSPILTLSPYLRQIHQEQAESSKHHGNNIELMEMLKAMR